MKNLLQKKYIYFALLGVFTFQIHGASETPLDLHARNYAPTGISLRRMLVGALALIGGAQAAPSFKAANSGSSSDSNFEVVAQKTYADGAFGPGYPVTYRLVSSRIPYETFVMVADNGAIHYGSSYLQHGEFTEDFVQKASVEGVHTLELGYGNGYHVDRMLDSIRRSKTNRLALVDISDSNTKNIREGLTSYSKEEPKTTRYMGLKASTSLDGKVMVYDQMPAQKFLKNAARAVQQVSLPLYDTIGAFHLMHFFRPREILLAIDNIHTILKPNGTFVITLSSPGTTNFLEYGKKSSDQPWAGSFYCDPSLYSHFKEASGRTIGMVATTLPALALADLLKAYGFEILKASSYSDIYYGKTDEPYAASNYEGVIARKVGDINNQDLLRWTQGATACDKIVGDEDMSPRANPIPPDDSKLEGFSDMAKDRIQDLFSNYCGGTPEGIIVCRKA